MMDRIRRLRRDWKMNVAWMMPRWLVYWCFVRMAAHATQGPWSSDHPDSVSVIDAMNRWDGK